MPRLAPKSLHLSETERNELQQLVNRHNTPQQIAKRARIILLADNGQNHRQIASRLGREFAYLLSLLQRFALISPFEGFSHRAIEVIDEFKDARFELSNASEIGSSFVTYEPKC